jgi:hypothetical protein
VVLTNFKNYVQKIRTPALKGLRFNRFVTDSYLNTLPANPPNPACDFLLHDGRACDAIQAAFLHDGPAIKIFGCDRRVECLDAGTAPGSARVFVFILCSREAWRDPFPAQQIATVVSAKDNLC